MNARMLILHLLAQRAERGATSTEVASAACITRRSAYQTIRRMAADLQVFPAGPKNLMRFYALKSWADAADKVLREEMARIAQEGKDRRKRLRNERLRKQAAERIAIRKVERSAKQKAATARALEKAQKATPWRKEAPTKRNTVKRCDLPIIVPANVKVTIAPTPVDYRYHVDPSHKGEFSRGKLGDTL